MSLVPWGVVLGWWWTWASECSAVGGDAGVEVDWASGVVVVG